MGGEQAKDKRQTSIQNLFLPLRNSNKIDNRLFDVTKQIVMRLHKGEYYLITEYFKNKETSTKIQNDKQKYLCNRVSKNDQVFYSCKTCSYLEGGLTYCQDCFIRQKHLGHDYTPIENQESMCYCGYDQLSDQRSFCKSHMKYRKQAVSLDPKIRRQVKLYVQLLLFLKQQAKYFELQPHIFQYYGEPLFQYLLYLAKGDIAYCRTIALISLQAADILTNLHIELRMVGKNLLENLIILASSSTVLANLLANIVDELFEVAEISRDLVRIYNHLLLLSGDQNNFPNNIFNKIHFDLPLCFKSQMEYFSNPQNCRFSMRKLPNQQSLNNFYEAIDKILTFNSNQIINRILCRTRVSEMFNFQRLSSEIVQKSIQQSSKSSMKCFQFIQRIVNKVNDKHMLETIIKDSLQYILKNKIPAFALFFQRVFALALYKYYDFNISNMSGLLTKLQSFYPQVKQEKYSMLVKFFSVRDDFHDQYQQKIKKTPFFLGFSSLTVLANDQLYLKIIANLLQNKEEVIQLYRIFITKRIFNGVSREQFYNKKLKNDQVLKKTIKKTKTFFTSLSNSIVHNADQFIIKGNNGDEKSNQSILSYLAQIFQGSNASEFKKNAQNIIQSSKVVKFIKEKLMLEGKKIHYKNQGENIIILSPCSQLFSSKLPEIIFQRMITLFCKSENPNKQTIYADEQSLQMWAQLLHNCISFIQGNGEVEGQIKYWLKGIIDAFLALGLQNKSESFMELMNRMQRQINNSPLNLYANNYKPIHEPIKNQQPVKQAQNIRNNKKKLKLQNIREKQKQMLEIHQMEEQKRTAECIVCKNSKTGNPFLLGHFGYKNIFNKVLQAQTPFLQFSSCGHYIHEDCLQQSHKGQFKIWYPCILCKTICNILLPNVSNVNEHGQAENQQDQLQRIIVFLKNLGGIYTFFYQDRKQLIQFGLQNVENVFPLLFKTLVYQITFYPILNLQYFQRSQLPVTKFLFNLLVFTSQKLKSIELFKKVGLKGHPFFISLYQYVSHRLRLFLQHKNHHMEIQNNLPKDITNLVEEISYFLQGRCQNIENISVSTKEYRQIVVQHFIKPPKDLTQLQKKGQACASCQKSVNNYDLCLLCGWLCCSMCTQVKKVHALEVHLSESVFLRNTNGKYIYVHQQLLGEYDSLYVDYLGQEYGGVAKLNFGDYQISKERWEHLIEDLLNNRLHREIMKVQ